MSVEYDVNLESILAKFRAKAKESRNFGIAETFDDLIYNVRCQQVCIAAPEAEMIKPGPAGGLDQEPNLELEPDT